MQPLKTTQQLSVRCHGRHPDTQRGKQFAERYAKYDWFWILKMFLHEIVRVAVSV